MPQTIWAKNSYLQDDAGLWYRPGFDPKTGCRHLLVSVTREGLDKGSVQERRFAHLHFWQLEQNKSELGFNVVYFDEDLEKDFAYRDREHVYEKDTVYGEGESIFFTPEMQTKIAAAMSDDQWFSREVFSDSVGGLRRERFLSALESSQSPSQPAISKVSFTAQIRRGTRFKANPVALREAALELRGYQQQLIGHVEEMNHQVEFALRQSGKSEEFQYMQELQYVWNARYRQLIELLTGLLRVADYVDRKADETERISKS